ncbi:hypothetical protein Tco_1022327 [Tanacetum coccineum]
MTNMHFGESHIGAENDNNSMDLLQTGNLLMMSSPNAESLLSQSFKLSNGIITSIWIGLLFVEMMTSCKLANLTVEEHLAFNVSLRMFTRSFVIQRRVEDLQLGVKSYQKKLNLIKPDMYRSDLKRREAYTAYSNPRGFIYQNKYKKNKLMRIDELHKFSDGTLNGFWTALNDRLKGIRMKYLPQAIWRQSDRDKAGAITRQLINSSRPEGLCRAWRNLLVGDRMRETFDCYKGPYDLSYDVLIITVQTMYAINNL